MEWRRTQNCGQIFTSKIDFMLITGLICFVLVLGIVGKVVSVLLFDYSPGLTSGYLGLQLLLKRRLAREQTGPGDSTFQV